MCLITDPVIEHISSNGLYHRKCPIWFKRFLEGNYWNIELICCEDLMDMYIPLLNLLFCRSQWPRGVRRRSAAARLLRWWVRIPPGAWMFVCCECRVFSGRGLCDDLITRPEESYRLWCVVVCDLETSRMRRPWPALGRSATEKKNTVLLPLGLIYLETIPGADNEQFCYCPL